MQITKELIEKFFLKECGQEEAQEVMFYLTNHQEILDHYLDKTEWDKELLFDNQTEAFWDEIWNEIKPVKPVKLRSIFLVKYAVAASLIAALVVFVSLYFSQSTIATKDHQQTKIFEHKVIANVSKVMKEITLIDGSIVQLKADSKIEFDLPFQNNKRHIYLQGEAFFKVAKDQKKPFTVFSGHISTTALGTAFKVTANQNSDQIIIHLYEGKVVVKSTLTAKNKFNSVYYLLPGDELVYNKITSLTSLTHKIGSKKKSANQLLSFDKEPLSDVFDQLAGKYNVHIQYSNSDLDNLYYIGSFERTDSIQNILENIIKLNGLKLISKNNEYIISKH